jgi:hypothetical protein
VENERVVRLRKQMEELVRSRVSLLEQDISNLQREVNESFTRLLERTDAAGVLPESDQTLAQISADVNAQVGQAGAESARLGADIALLRDSVVELDEQRTQAEVLNALVARAANFAPRVVLFVVKGTNALAWAARGFDESMSNNAIRGLSVSLQSDTALRAGINSQQTFYSGPDQQADNQLIFSRLGNIHPKRVLVVPLKVRGKTAAILYSDAADRGEESINVEAIELLVHTSGLVVELVSLRARMGEGAQAPARQAESGAGAPHPGSGPLPGSSQGSSQAGASQSAAHPNAQSAPSGPLPQAPQPAPASAGASGELNQPAASAPPAFFRPAAEPPQAPQNFTQQNFTQQAETRAPAVESSPAAGARSAALDEEERLHKDARRFARLLVSEIKLYNEQKVAEGRRNNDLYDRLKEDIDRSRQMYEKRVSPVVAARFDYFYDELVNTLAEGDKARLGSDHPGPTVQV